MALPSFRKKAQTISKDKIRSGQVLEIKYDGDTDLILVIDPNAKTVTASSQGRVNKLHAIKLRETGLTDAELIDLVHSIKNLGRNPAPEKIYETFKTSKYNTGKRSYRTYSPDKIANVMRITVGQMATKTNKIKMSNGSVLYGVVHGAYVEILPEHYDELEQELVRVGGNTFYEGPVGHEEVTKELLKYVYDKDSITATSWEPTLREDVSGDLYRVTELFGGGSDTLWGQIKDIVAERGIATDKTLLEVLAAGSGQKSGMNNWWSEKVATKEQIMELSSLSGVNTAILNRPYDTISKSEFVNFHLEVQKRAFASYEGKDYEQFIDSPIERKTTLISRIRQRNLYKLMRSTPAIYFAGASHVDDMRKFVV